MHRLLSKLFFLLVFNGFMPTAPAGAAEVGAGEAKQMQAVIQAQLNAFAADDAKRAFSFAASAGCCAGGTVLSIDPYL